nr:MAG TPA: hypothetical protein [Caudoviricetes sp.]
MQSCNAPRHFTIFRHKPVITSDNRVVPAYYVVAICGHL